jgi:hypothetical protein
MDVRKTGCMSTRFPLVTASIERLMYEKLRVPFKREIFRRVEILCRPTLTRRSYTVKIVNTSFLFCGVCCPVRHIST